VLVSAMKNALLILTMALIGLAAAFFHPAQPYQMPKATNGRDNTFLKSFVHGTEFVDAGLDNPEIENDDSIQAARKCGFCIGVSSSLYFIWM